MNYADISVRFLQVEYHREDNDPGLDSSARTFLHARHREIYDFIRFSLFPWNVAISRLGITSLYWLLFGNRLRPQNGSDAPLNERGFRIYLTSQVLKIDLKNSVVLPPSTGNHQDGTGTHFQYFRENCRRHFFFLLGL